MLFRNHSSRAPWWPISDILLVTSYPLIVTLTWIPNVGGKQLAGVQNVKRVIDQQRRTFDRATNGVWWNVHSICVFWCKLRHRDQRAGSISSFSSSVAVRFASVPLLHHLMTPLFESPGGSQINRSGIFARK